MRRTAGSSSTTRTRVASIGASIQAGNKLFPHRNRGDTAALHAAFHRNALEEAHMKAILTLVRDLLVRRNRERMIEELDEYTLRDIGLEREALRARERRRLSLHFGGY